MAFNMVKFFNMPFASVIRVRRLQSLASVMKISPFSDEDETKAQYICNFNSVGICGFICHIVFNCVNERRAGGLSPVLVAFSPAFRCIRMLKETLFARLR